MDNRIRATFGREWVERREFVQGLIQLPYDYTKYIQAIFVCAVKKRLPKPVLFDLTQNLHELGYCYLLSLLFKYSVVPKFLEDAPDLRKCTRFRCTMCQERFILFSTESVCRSCFQGHGASKAWHRRYAPTKKVCNPVALRSKDRAAAPPP